MFKSNKAADKYDQCETDDLIKVTASQHSNNDNKTYKLMLSSCNFTIFSFGEK